ncbi:hypothetical protein C8R44DRAFT_638705 [Mycena epipterygia]|nr:hypothetical protein C8R44DRAFT_638705 [Mycena epipterygia]
MGLTHLKAPKDVENCPYKGGTFLLSCDLPAGYPRDPPEVRFVTFILHPNVSPLPYSTSRIQTRSMTGLKTGQGR